MFELAEYNRKIADLESRSANAGERAKLGFGIKADDHKKFRMVFVGQYSAGKSSILRALTGKSDIRIGAGITTDEVQAYEWSGIEVVDTPGIHTEKRPDHDRRSYDAIASADMLVFVVTNELFDSNLAGHFRKLAIDNDKGGEMILVVNKMDRTYGGNTTEQRTVIRDYLAKVVSPYKPEDLGLCFLSADSYFLSKEMRPGNPGAADRLLSESGYDEFVGTLNRFVRERHLSSQLTTRLYEIDDFLQKAIKKLEAGTGDADVNALEEHCLQQRHVLSEGRQRLEQQLSDMFTDAASKIRNLGREAAGCLEEGCEENDVERKLHNAVQNEKNIVDECMKAAEKKITEGLQELDIEMGKVENSEFSANLKSRLQMRYDSLPDNVKNILSKTGDWSKRIGKIIVENGRNASSSGGWSLSNFSGSNLHSLIKNVGHLVGYKFRPWEAAKWTKWATGTATAISVFGIGLSVFTQIQSDQEEANLREELRKDRQNVRGEAEQWADSLENCGRAYVSENVTRLIGSKIQQIDGDINEIRNSRENKNALCMELEGLHRECLGLVREIHGLGTEQPG